MTLDPTVIEAIAQRSAQITVELLRQPSATVSVLTRSEAKAYVKRNSEGAFFDWCQKWCVKPAFRGRYSKAHLDVALSREARARR